MNKSSASIRKFAVIAAGVYFGVLAFLVVGAAFSGELAGDSVGLGLLFTGLAIFIIGFIFIAAQDRGAGISQHRHRDEDFKQWWKQERPILLVTWAIIFAAALMMGTGYILLHLFNPG
jgi:biotin transporter BioY